MTSKKNQKVKKVKYLLIFVYLVEATYLMLLPQLIMLYIFINTIIHGFTIVYILKDE